MGLHKFEYQQDIRYIPTKLLFPTQNIIIYIYSKHIENNSGIINKKIAYKRKENYVNKRPLLKVEVNLFSHLYVVYTWIQLGINKQYPFHNLKQRKINWNWFSWGNKGRYKKQNYWKVLLFSQISNPNDIQWYLRIVLTSINIYQSFASKKLK